MIKADIEMQQLRYRINKELGAFALEVGIVQDGPAAIAKKELKAPLAGGPANKKAGNSKEETLSSLLEAFDSIYNLLVYPWTQSDNKDCALVVEEMVKDMNRDTKSKRRFLNAAQAVVRNPIARGDYGDNSPEWVKTKGFNRLLINTGSMFSRIKARLKSV